MYLFIMTGCIMMSCPNLNLAMHDGVAAVDITSMVLCRDNIAISSTIATYKIRLILVNRLVPRGLVHNPLLAVDGLLVRARDPRVGMGLRRVTRRG